MKCEKRICPTCNGTGLGVNHQKQGKQLAREREAAAVDACDVARLLRVTPSYISHLESGSRKWTTKLITQYQAAVARLSKNLA